MLNNEASAASAFTLANITTATSTVTGSAVDVRDAEGDLMVVQAVGAVSGATPTLDGKLQDSADGATGWADVSGATFTQVTAANNVQKIVVRANAMRRYVRYVGTIGGTSPSFALGALAFGRKQAV